MFDLRTVTDKEAHERVRKAMLDLLVYGKLAGLVLLGESVLIKESEAVRTMATDGRSLFYAPSWVRGKPRASIMFDLLHEFGHIFGNHVGRRGTRDKDRWGYAADVRVAHDTLRILRKMKPDWQLDADHIPAHPWAADLTVEQIYDKLPAEQQPPKNEDLLDPAPQQQTKESQDEFLRKFSEALAQAAAAVEMTGTNIEKDYGKAFDARLRDVIRGTVPWGRMLQGRLIGELGRDVATYAPPNKRFLPEIILPTYKAKMERELVLLIDVSASIDKDLISKFSAEITPAALRAKRTLIITFDAVIRETVEVKDPRRALESVKFITGGHSYTSVVDAFAMIDKRKSAAIAALTDGYILLPERPYPRTNWVMPRGGKPQPWGHNYFMELAW
jgi:predicted metal-dependent peptidase